MSQIISEKTKINMWTRIVPIAIIISSVSSLKLFTIAPLVLYLFALLAFYKLIDKWDSPVVKHIWHLLKGVGIVVSFLIAALFIHLAVYLAST